MARVSKAPFGYLVMVTQNGRRWIGYRRTGDLRRVYELLARRGVPKKVSYAALTRADPKQARIHGMDR